MPDAWTFHWTTDKTCRQAGAQFVSKFVQKPMNCRPRGSIHPWTKVLSCNVLDVSVLCVAVPSRYRLVAEARKRRIKALEERRHFIYP